MHLKLASHSVLRFLHALLRPAPFLYLRLTSILISSSFFTYPSHCSPKKLSVRTNSTSSQIPPSPSKFAPPRAPIAPSYHNLSPPASPHHFPIFLPRIYHHLPPQHTHPLIIISSSFSTLPSSSSKPAHSHHTDHSKYHHPHSCLIQDPSFPTLSLLCCWSLTLELDFQLLTAL